MSLVLVNKACGWRRRGRGGLSARQRLHVLLILQAQIRWYQTAAVSVLEGNIQTLRLSQKNARGESMQRAFTLHRFPQHGVGLLWAYQRAWEAKTSPQQLDHSRSWHLYQKIVCVALLHVWLEGIYFLNTNVKTNSVFFFFKFQK